MFQISLQGKMNNFNWIKITHQNMKERDWTRFKRANTEQTRTVTKELNKLNGQKCDVPSHSYPFSFILLFWTSFSQVDGKAMPTRLLLTSHSNWGSKPQNEIGMSTTKTYACHFYSRILLDKWNHSKSVYNLGTYLSYLCYCCY